jgi:hypothetical protein
LESNGELDIRSDFSIDFDQSLSEDGNDFTSAESILETTAEENGERERFAKLVWARRWTGCLSWIDISKFQ